MGIEVFMEREKGFEPPTFCLEQSPKELSYDLQETQNRL